MPNGKKMIEEVRCIVADDIKVPAKVLNRMILVSLVELYDKVDELQPALRTNRILTWVLGAATVSLLGALFSGKLALVWR
mgnify:CR=1 FL=1